ncbi:PREDICTED: uncharacterized protein LOC105547821 [Mandrillus leucophaeus]|uniref:uncharacterized protein LOC105547821 n=1 Tax=Mandrillus leucophaeus TaxID=9568 RepID=UPI0005F4D285|nr:PREDICTED: uncharacterized protein LOC105547821 [Mandrillus leucophaeus]
MPAAPEEEAQGRASMAASGTLGSWPAGTFHPGSCVSHWPSILWKHTTSGKDSPDLRFSKHGVPQEFWAGGLVAVLEMTPSPSPWGTQEGPARMCSLWVVGWCPCRGVGVRDLVPVHAGVRCKHVCAVQRDACGESRTRVPRRRGGAVTSVLCLFLIKTFPLFSYKFASCKQIYKDPPLVKSGFE